MFTIFYGFLITLIGYLCAKPLNRRFPQIPLLVFGMFIVIGLLSVLHVPYEQYRLYVNDLFGHLLGYVTVALAIPLAAMRYDDLPIKSVIGILLFASISAVALPMGLAYLLHMSEPTILAFATRAVTTPIALNIATLLHAPETLVTLIVILSGVIGAAFSPFLLKHIHDESIRFSLRFSCTRHRNSSSLATWACCRSLRCIRYGIERCIYCNLATNINVIFWNTIIKKLIK